MPDDSETIYEVLEAFDSAKTEQDYRKAKQLCCRFFSAPEQLAFIDAARSAFARTRGVL